MPTTDPTVFEFSLPTQLYGSGISVGATDGTVTFTTGAYPVTVPVATTFTVSTSTGVVTMTSSSSTVTVAATPQLPTFEERLRALDAACQSRLCFLSNVDETLDIDTGPIDAGPALHSPRCT